MNQGRRTELIKGLNGIATKIFDATPKAEGWSIQQINAEVRRHGSAPGFDVIQGALKHLVECGLVKQSGIKGEMMFQQIRATPKAQSLRDLPDILENQEDMATDTLKLPVSMKEVDPLIAGLLIKARKLVDIASDIEEIANQLQVKLAEPSEELAKLRRFKEAFKDL